VVKVFEKLATEVLRTSQQAKGFQRESYIEVFVEKDMDLFFNQLENSI